MKKPMFALIILALALTGNIRSQDLQTILNNHFKTIGQENLLKMNTMIATGKTLQMGMEMPFKSITKRPDKAYLEVDIQGALMKQVYDGKKGWMIAPWTGSGEPVDLVGPDLKSVREMAEMDGNLWNYKEKGHQLELLGTEDLDGTGVYALRLTKKDGDIEYYYMDSENFVVLKMVRKIMVNEQEAEVEILLGNYQEVDGIVIPFSTEQNFNGQTGMTLLIEEIRFDQEVDDALFTKPLVQQAE